MTTQDARRAVLFNDVLKYLHRVNDDSAEACNLWERIHVEMGCKECIAKRNPTPPLQVSEDEV